MLDRKVVLVDLDNVVYPWTEVMAHLVAREGLSTGMPNELVELARSWAVWDDWAVPKGGFNYVWEQAILSEEMWGVTDTVTARPISRSARSLWQLNDKEWHIHLITHRLNKFRLHDQAVTNTATWLRWANIPYRSLTFTEDKHSVQGDVIIDDNLHNLIGHNAPTKILYPTNSNREWRQAYEAGTDDLDISPDEIILLQEGEHLFPWDEIVEKLGDGLRSSDSRPIR